MQIGWIDFSKSDRDKVLSVIQLLREPGVLDELGIGPIRDAFSDYFFPGISTVQTRAKYFLIVPYVLKEAGEGQYGTDINRILARIDDKERDCAEKLIDNSKSNDGIIGSDVLQHGRWVVRKPSDIYWGGIRRFGIFKEPDFSIREYLESSLKLRDAEKGKAAGNRSGGKEALDWDDKDAGDFDYKSFWNLPTYSKGWDEGLTIDLTQEEARFLKRQIETSLSDTLLAYLLKNHVDVSTCENFAALTKLARSDAPADLYQMMELAKEFGDLVYLSRIRYNMILSQGRNERAIEQWDMYRGDLSEYASVDLESIFNAFGVKCNPNLQTFLKELKAAFLDNDIAEADDVIRKREAAIKSSRAKLPKAAEMDPRDLQKWFGGGQLDYRLAEVKRITADIYAGEASGNV